MPLSTTVATIRALKSEDAEALVALRLEVAAESEVAMGCSFEEEAARSIERFRQQLASSSGVTFGAFHGARLVGAASILRPELASSGHKTALWGVVVSPEFRRRAIGRSLVEACVCHAAAGGARRVNLTVYVASQAAIRLYESIGFRAYGREPEALCIKGSYYDALLMSLSTEGHNPSIERTSSSWLLQPEPAAHRES